MPAYPWINLQVHKYKNWEASNRWGSQGVAQVSHAVDKGNAVLKQQMDYIPFSQKTGIVDNP
jgi:hypothetical protein